MLLIISDLHFVDGTAGEHNLSERAYAKVLGGLNVQERFASNGIKEFKILFLGDIFDVMRSTAWLDGSDLRPWSAKSNAEISQANAKQNDILATILAHPDVKATCARFKKFKADLQEAAGNDKVSFQFIPGNHDRWLHVDPQARKTVVSALALDESPKKFKRRYAYPEYSVAAFHGHEIDIMNMGVGYWEKNPFNDRAYGAPSLGEAITIDIATRIPVLVNASAAKIGLPPKQHAELVLAMQNLDNIRPISAVFRWLRHFAHQYGKKFVRVLDEVIEQVFDDFSSLDFVKDWSERIDQRWVPPDAPALTRFATWLRDMDFHEYVRGIDSVAEAEDLLSAAETLTLAPYDRLQRAFYGHPFFHEVVRDVNWFGTAKPRYFVYGHTHHPEVVPIRNDGVEEVVFNTGTFRPRVFSCDPEGSRGFVEYKTLSFAVFYREDEKGASGGSRRYEFWEARLAGD